MGNGVAGVLFINDLLLHGASGHPQMGGAEDPDLDREP